MRKKIIVGLLAVLLLVWAGNFVIRKQRTVEIPTASGITIQGMITDQDAALAAFATLETNLKAANAEDVELYVSTLVTSAHEETKKEMRKFFKAYDIEHTLLSFEVVKQEDNRMLVKAQQKAINKGSKKYRDHITEANHTFTKENGKWVIEETAMSNTKFI